MMSDIDGTITRCTHELPQIGGRCFLFKVLQQPNINIFRYNLRLIGLGGSSARSEDNWGSTQVQAVYEQLQYMTKPIE